MNAPVIVIMGPPGAGKGTQAELLAAQHGLLHISSGELVRASQDPAIVKAHDSGVLIKSSDVERIMGQALAQVDPRQGILIDRFPSMPGEARWLLDELQRLDRPLRMVIFLELSDDEIIRRLSDRGRADDAADRLKVRLGMFRQHTVPTLKFFESQGLLTRVNGLGSVEEVHEGVEKVLHESKN
jgi:adenylate kinase